jgi:hypothetical protein
VTPDEGRAMLLYCHSHILWGIPSLYGGDNNDYKDIIDNLQVVIEKLDPFSIQAVAVSKRKYSYICMYK